MKKKTVTKKTIKGTAEEQAKAMATQEHLEMLRKAGDAARDAAYRAIVEHLLLVWNKHGLGKNGVIVLPASWHEGPEQLRRTGFMSFKSYMPGALMLQRSATETITALLDSTDQSSAARDFLTGYQRELAQLGTLAY